MGMIGSSDQVFGHAKNVLWRSLVGWGCRSDVPKGHFPVYVGESRKRFVVPVKYLNHPLFQMLLERAEDEFGFTHRAGGLRVPCPEDMFLHVTSQLS